MPEFYQLNSVKAAVLEHWWGCRGNPIAFLIFVVCKLLRVRTGMASDDANVDSVLALVQERLPQPIEEHFAGLTAQLNAYGFIDPVFHYLFDPGTTTHIYWATFRHESGQHCARIHNRYWDRAPKRERALFVLFITGFSDGTFLVSSSGRPDTAAPPEVIMNRMPNASVPGLWTAHQTKSEELRSSKVIVPVRTSQDLIEETERLHAVQRDFHLHRGFFRVQTEKEAGENKEFSERIETLRGQGAKYPDVLAEIARLESQGANWTQAIWLLVLSVAVFIAAGTARWNRATTLWLIPILFFHEAGHWVAMKAFGYRNMRMFFIPLFGAAVLGQNRTVPGWKKALVSLAGPVPGIVLGAALAAVAIATDNIPIRRCAALLIVLNVLNLVPVLPLDGGRFLHVTLFCRSRWLDFGFRVLAVCGLVGLSAIGFGRFLVYLAIALGVGLPLSFRLGKALEEVKAQKLPPPVPGEERIPQATAEGIVAALKNALPTTATRMLAQHALNIYETLNARPPSVLATLGLMGIYLGAIVLAVISAVGLIFARQYLIR